MPQIADAFLMAVIFGGSWSFAGTGPSGGTGLTEIPGESILLIRQDFDGQFLEGGVFSAPQRRDRRHAPDDPAKVPQRFSVGGTQRRGQKVFCAGAGMDRAQRREVAQIPTRVRRRLTAVQRELLSNARIALSE